MEGGGGRKGVQGLKKVLMGRGRSVSLAIGHHPSNDYRFLSSKYKKDLINLIYHSYVIVALYKKRNGN